jgi:ABC-type Fe3+-siderophore transport system permease subunit
MAAGAAVAVVVFVMFVLLPGETTGSPVLYAGLAVVVAAALGALFAAALTLVTAWRRTREL